jgi:hypothetical protein
MDKKQKITERNLRVWAAQSLPKGEQEVVYRDDALAGFQVVLRSNGQIVFQVYKRVKSGRVIRRKLGEWVDDPTATGQVAAARMKAMELLTLMNNGIDITEADKKAKVEAERQQVNKATLQSAVDVYLADAQKRLKESSKVTAGRAINQMKTHAGELALKMLATPIVDIKVEQVRTVHALHSEKSPAAADGAMRILSAAVSGWIDSVTADDDDAPIPRNPIKLALRRKDGRKALWNKVAPRSVHVEDAWLDPWWQATEQLAPETRWVLRLMLVSGLRVSEAMGIRWENIDEKAGTLIITNTKNGKPHTLPLTRGIEANLPIRPANASGLVFPNVSANRLRRAHAAIEELTGRHWTNHDLRRSCATVATRAGVPIYILKRLLNHTPTGRDVTEAHYVQVTPADIKEALDKIEQLIRSCVKASARPEIEQTILTIVS